MFPIDVESLCYTLIRLMILYIVMSLCVFRFRSFLLDSAAYMRSFIDPATLSWRTVVTLGFTGEPLDAR